MPHSEIHSYLGDHLAGAAGAVALMEHVERAFSGDVSTVLHVIRIEVEEDRQTLLTIASAVGVDESVPRKLSGWIGEKLTELKLTLDGGRNGSLTLLESLEAIALGIEGKLALWKGLGHAAANDDRLRVVDYGLLARRAMDQRERIEALRLQAVLAVFA